MPLLGTLHLIAEGAPLAVGFYGVSTPSKEHWLLPLDPVAIQQMDWNSVLALTAGNRIPGFLEAEESGRGRNRVVEIKITSNGTLWKEAYSESKRNRDLGGGNALDLRIWPNFCFPVIPKVPVNPADRIYYFRIRQQPVWKLNVLVLARIRDDEGRVIRTELLRLETGSVVPGQPDRFRGASFHYLPAEGARRVDGSFCRGHAEPIGIYFENRGLLLFSLYTLPQVGDPYGVPWRIGIDFGTSNSCVAFLTLGSGIEANPRVEKFEIQTATMHESPVYEEISDRDPGILTEGAAAIFDFPYRYGNEPLLTEQFYFPSQIVTRSLGPPGQPDFRFEHGFIFPRNAVLDNMDARELLDGHPPLPRNEHRVFRLVHDVKWSNRAYRKAFLWHLYKLLILHAARRGARIVEAAFSFPQAFDPDALRRYRNEVTEVFGDHGGIPLRTESFISESVAVHRRVTSEELRADRLVIDVGGGTTDYTGLIVAAPSFQTSYCLAAGYVNEYFRSSPSLRKVLRDTAYKILGKAKSDKQRDQRDLLDDLLEELQKLQQEGVDDLEGKRTASYNQAAFFGLLGMLDDTQFSEMAKNLTDQKIVREDVERKSLCGFFYTLVVIYSALAYQGARLLRQHRRPSPNLQLDFIGNGSRYLLLLNSGGCSCSYLIERVVQSVWLSTVEFAGIAVEVQTKVSTKGKVFVAEGLVLNHDGMAPPEVLPDKDSIMQFTAINKGLKVKSVVSSEPLEGFVRLLAGCLPSGKVKISPRTEITVVPYCQPDMEEELSALVRKALVKGRKRVEETALDFVDWQRQATEMHGVNEVAERAKLEAAYSVEPVFITCIRCLLDEIRQNYAL